MFVDIPWMLVSALAVLVFLLFVLLVQRAVRRKVPADVDHADLAIDVGRLSDMGPPAGPDQLTVYHVPVRLAVLVLAPVGRGSPLPSPDRLPGICDQLLPGLSRVLGPHKVQFRSWPPQLSSHGFAQALFKNARLPGDRGKQTPWCSVAGRFEADGEFLLAGLVCCAANDNSLSEIIIDKPGGWLDVMRVSV